MHSLHRMISIDLNTPSASLTTHSKNLSPKNYNHSRNFPIKPFESDTIIYQKYFHIGIAKICSIFQIIFAVVILICQLCTTGLLIGPRVPVNESSAVSTSDRVGLGIWASIVTTLAAGATFWAVNKANFFRLQSSMLLNFCSVLGYIILEYLVLLNTVPRIQERIHVLQQSKDYDTTLEARTRLLLAETQMEENVSKNAQSQLQAELHRLYAALVLSIVMALCGIFQFLLHLFMTIKTGRAICLGKTYFEGRLFHMQNLGRCWRNKSFRMEPRDTFKELPKLERSDALPPPPYDTGYFHPSLTA